MDECVQLLSNNCSWEHTREFSLLLKTIVGNRLLQTEEEEGMKPFEQLEHIFFFFVLLQGCVWPGMSLGSPPPSLF